MSKIHGEPVMDFYDRLSRRLKLSDLRMLDAVVQWGSMSKAAANLNISQSAVSKALGEIERALGVDLLDRNPQGVEPTEYGRALLIRAAAIFDELRQAKQDIQYLADPQVGEVRIGCGEPLAAGFLCGVIKQLARQYPQIVCHVLQTPTTATLEYRELRERRVEVTLGRIKEPFVEEDLHADILFFDQQQVVAGKRSKWVHRRKIELADLVDEPWLLPLPDTFPRSLLEDAFRTQGLRTPRPGLISTSFNLYFGLLSTGMYVTALPESVLRYSVLRVSCKKLPVRFPRKPTPIAAITLKHRSLSPIAKLFIGCARACAKPLVGGAT